jgi:hypothetical protein
MIKFDFAVSAMITEETIKKMISSVVEDQTGRQVKKVEFNYSKQYEDRPSGGSTTMLTGATVFFEESQS